MSCELGCKLSMGEVSSEESVVGSSARACIVSRMVWFGLVWLWRALGLVMDLPTKLNALPKGDFPTKLKV